MTSSDAEFDFESPLANAELAAAAAAVVAGTSGEPEPTFTSPTDGPVTLPGGFRRMITTPAGSSLRHINKAWIRELTGEHEERIDKARTRGGALEFVTEVLLCGVERLGDDVPTREDVRELLIGDQEFLMLEISRATFGNDIEYEDYPCPYCHVRFGLTVHKDEDIPVTRLDSVDETEFEVRLSKDRVALVRLPTGSIQALALEAEPGAAANTVMIANCVVEIRGGSNTVRMDGDLDMARNLGVRDRRAIISAMSEKMPGPRYSEVTFTHPDCGNEIRMEVSASELFLGL